MPGPEYENEPGENIAGDGIPNEYDDGGINVCPRNVHPQYLPQYEQPSVPERWR